jgi:hypothetical protein
VEWVQSFVETCLWVTLTALFVQVVGRTLIDHYYVRKQEYMDYIRKEWTQEEENGR